MEINFKYKVNDEVWLMQNNRPISAFIKDSLFHVVTKKQHGTNQYREAWQVNSYTVYTRCNKGTNDLVFNESQIFKTKEELLKSL